MAEIVKFGPQILLACHPQTGTLLKDFMRKFRRTCQASTAKDAITFLERKAPNAVISEIELPDGKIWQIVNAVRSGRLCPSDTPIIGLTHGERCLALERMAEMRHVNLYHDPTMDDLASFVEEILNEKPKLPRILLIDDDEGVRSLISNELGKSFSIEVANTGVKGIDAWIERRHDLVVLDLELPDIHGVEVLKRIKAEDPDQPVLVLSGFLNGENAASISLHGATHSADKGVLENPKILMRRCLEALEWRRLNVILDTERRQRERASLVRAARDWLSDPMFPPCVLTARSLLDRAALETQEETPPEETPPEDLE